MTNSKETASEKAKEIKEEPVGYDPVEETRSQERTIRGLGALMEGNRQDIQRNANDIRSNRDEIQGIKNILGYMGEFIQHRSDVQHTGKLASEPEMGRVQATGERWSSYIARDFELILNRVQGLENAGNDTLQIEYCMAELEVLLGRIADKARCTGRKYEGRLAASLRHVCMLYEPEDISDDQARQLAMCVRYLVEEWDKLNRERVGWIRAKLLDVGLTWLPVTKKANKEIEEAKRAKTTTDGGPESAE